MRPVVQSSLGSAIRYFVTLPAAISPSDGLYVALSADGPGLKVANCPEAAQYIRREYRQGWTL